MDKILLYIDMMDRSGAQRVMGSLANRISALGIDTILVNDFILDATIPQYSISQSVRRFFLQDTNTGNPILKNIRRLVRLRQIIRREKPDLVLSFLGRPNIRMLIAGIGLRPRKIVSVRNDPNREYGRNALVRFLTGRLFLLADGCVFQTPEAASYFPKAVQDRARVIMNPVDRRFYNAERDGHPKNIISVGRLEKQKNQKMLIEAFAEIAPEFPEDDLVILGEGPLRGELEDLCGRLSVRERVHMPGNVSAVENELAKAKLFVFPSDYEGMPNALMEAMAVGVPSISTDCPCGGPKMLNADDGGLMLIPCGDKEQLINAMRTLLSDADKRESNGRKHKKKAMTFQAEKVFSQWEEYLLGVASGEKK